MSPPRRLIVDGYNVVHAWPDLRSALESAGLEEARRRLVRRLAEHAASSGDDVTVVFDSHGRSPGALQGEGHDGVRVLFGSRAQSADHVIERTVSDAVRSGAGREVTVVTSDRLQRELVIAMGASVIGARAFGTELGVGAVATRSEMARRRQDRHHGRRLDTHIDEQTRRRLEEIRRGAPPR